MKFSIDRKALLDRMNVTNRAISQHSPKPILSGLYMNLDEKGLYLIGSDGQLSIQCSLWPDERTRLHTEEGGRLVAEAKYLLDIIRKLDGETIRFELIDQAVLQIQDDYGTFKLRVLPASDYPMPDFEKPPVHFHIKGGQLRSMVSQVGFAASEKDVRQVLQGVHLESADGKLVCSATDSYRLARKIIYLPDLPEFEITIPERSLNEVTRTLDSDEEVDVFIGQRKIQFLFEGNLMQTALYEGSYPAVDRIIPREFSSELEVGSKEFESILERSMIYLSEKVSVVRMECSPNDVKVFSSNKEVGSSDQYLPDARYEGKDIRVSFNGQFMLQALKGLECRDGRVRLQFIGELKPIRITNPEDEHLEMIVVPLRTR